MGGVLGAWVVVGEDRMFHESMVGDFAVYRRRLLCRFLEAVGVLRSS